MPDAEVAVDEGVVQPEDGVGGRGIRVAHDGSDAVVAVGVSTTLRAPCHLRKGAVLVAAVYHGRVGVGQGGAVAVAGETVASVGCAGSDVDGEVGELLERED